MTYWNAYVANTQMHGKGTFFDRRLNDKGQFPVAVKAGHANIRKPHFACPSKTGWSMHKAAEIGIDDFQADRSPDKQYRTPPLRGLFTRTKGGFYHDGRFPTLDVVVNHYDNHFNLKLSGDQKRNLVEYLKSL